MKSGVAAERGLGQQDTAAQPSRRLSLIFLVIMVLGCIGLDQVTKVHAQDSLMRWSDEKELTLYQGSRYPIFSTGSPRGGDAPGEVNPDSFYFSLAFNYVRNLGAAWGALSGLPDAVRVPFFYAVTILAVILIAVYIKQTPAHHRLAVFSLSLVLSGAIGNFIDRLRLGYVIDWIDVRWNIFGWRYDFPNFNVADSAITVGVTLLIFDMMVLEGRRRKVPAKVAPA